MVSSDKKLANAVGGRTARACDNCIRRRARCFCAADDVFLCQSCDALVHSASPLAGRHERVRLKTASLEKPTPSWDHGFTKKPRTPRGNNNKNTSHQIPKSEESGMSFNLLHLVPEIRSDEYETNTMNSEDQLLYQVPVFDPFATELCFCRNSNEAAVMTMDQLHTSTSFAECYRSKLTLDLNNFNGIVLPSDMELAEFAADVESLLGSGLDEESFDMEGLGLVDCRENDSRPTSERVKIEEEMKCEVVESEIEMMRDPFQLSFDYESPEDEKVVVEDGGDGNRMGVVKEVEECEVVGDDHVNIHTENEDNIDDNNKKKRLLKLDYEGVIAAWDDQGSPWTTGDQPEFDANDCWPHCMDRSGIMQSQPCGMMRRNLDGEREARVSRYREKRRTRLFSKKIRYEVRKLNAEKRPRMKGRFVKRTNFTATTSGFPLFSK